MTDKARAPDPAGIKLRFLWLSLWMMPGVTRGNAWTYLLAAYTTIGLLTFVAIGTPYILHANLGIPVEQQGQYTSSLQLLNEIALLLVFAPMGALADRIGRRQVYSIGMLAMGVAYILYPLATSVTELGIYRVIYAVGIGAATGMLGTIVADYPQNVSRGKLIAVGGILNGVGVVTVALGLGRLPNVFVNAGYDEITAGRYAHWIIAAICIAMAAVIAVGLQKGTPAPHVARPSILALTRSGIREARNPRIALAYACAFIARSDLVILGTFTVLWGQTAGIAQGLTAAQASGQGSRIFGTASVAALLWLFVLGPLLDRVHRVTGVALCMGLAGIAYLSMLLVGDPLGRSSLGWFVLLGIGQISAFLGATTLISAEAPAITRGSVIGVFNVFGAVGILFSTGLGGWLFDKVSPAAPFAVIGALALVIAAAAVVVRVRAPGEQGRDPNAVVAALH